MSSRNDKGKAAPPVGTAHGVRSWSLATRLTAWYAASAFTLVLVATVFLYWVLVTNLDREMDETLADQVRILRKLLLDRPEDKAALVQEVEWEWGARRHSQLYMRILDEQGQPVMETPEMGELLATELFPSPVPADAEPGRGKTVRSPSRTPFRVLAAQATVGAPGRPVRTLQVAFDRSHEEDLLAGYRQGLWLVLGLAVIASAVGGYQIARRGIGPVLEITKATRRIHSTTLNERLEFIGLPAELASLAATFNEMLDRLEESFSRLSRFSADIAHELRTPVNNLRGEIEVTLRKARTPEEYRDVLSSCLEEGIRLSQMIDGLLFLARAENPGRQVQKERIDIGQELAALRDFYEVAASEAGITLTVKPPVGIVAEVDRTLFQLAVGNLVENALTHTDAEGVVTLAAKCGDRTVSVSVSDTGCGIAESHLPRLFDRFYRVDAARAAASGGVGLGLAIVKSIAELHGGSVEITSEVGHGTSVTLAIPIANGSA